MVSHIEYTLIIPAIAPKKNAWVFSVHGLLFNCRCIMGNKCGAGVNTFFFFLDCYHISFSVCFIRLNFPCSHLVSGQGGYKREELAEHKEGGGRWEHWSSAVSNALSVALFPLDTTFHQDKWTGRVQPCFIMASWLPCSSLHFAKTPSLPSFSRLPAAAHLQLHFLFIFRALSLHTPNCHVKSPLCEMSTEALTFFSVGSDCNIRWPE